MTMVLSVPLVSQMSLEASGMYNTVDSRYLDLAYLE